MPGGHGHHGVVRVRSGNAQRRSGAGTREGPTYVGPSRRMFGAPYRGYKSRTDRSVQQCAALASNAPRAAHGTGEAKATLLMDPTYFERLIAALWTRCSPRPRRAPALGDGWMKAPSPVPADRVVSMRAPESPRESAQVAARLQLGIGCTQRSRSGRRRPSAVESTGATAAVGSSSRLRPATGIRERRKRKIMRIAMVSDDISPLATCGRADTDRRTAHSADLFAALSRAATT